MRSAAVSVALFLLAFGTVGCETTTTTPEERAAARDAAVAKVRNELEWLQLGDGAIGSAMLAFCGESSLEDALLAPTIWLNEWGFSQPNAVLAETNEARTDAWETNLRGAGFGGPEHLDLVRAFAIEVGVFARPYCPDKWDRLNDN